MRRLMSSLTTSSRTVKANFSVVEPGIDTIAISPSQVLQIQPFRENFWTHPARSPEAYDHDSATQKYEAISAATSNSPINTPSTPIPRLELAAIRCSSCAEGRTLNAGQPGSGTKIDTRGSGPTSRVT